MGLCLEQSDINSMANIMKTAFFISKSSLQTEFPHQNEIEECGGMYTAGETCSPREIS